MPIIHGIETTRVLNKEFPEIGIIAVSILDEDSCITDMIEAEAKGYLLKSAHRTEVMDAIHTVYNKQNYFCKEISAKINKLPKEDHNPDIRCQLTEVEKKIIKLISQEFSNKEIALQLGIKKRTVEWHRYGIMQKIHARNSAGIVAFAIKHNILASK